MHQYPLVPTFGLYMAASRIVNEIDNSPGMGQTTHQPALGFYLADSIIVNEVEDNPTSIRTLPG